jgi:hypothetical protein
MSTNLLRNCYSKRTVRARHRFRMALSRARVYRRRLTDAQLRCRERVQLEPSFDGRLSEMLSSLYYRSCGGM